MAKARKKYVGDFETTTTPEDVRVWASCLVDIDTSETAFIGNDIESFFDFLKDKNTVVYFHNLKFDGEFILSYLLKNKYKHNDSKKPKTFETLITDTGLFYSITVYFEKKNKQYKKVVFYDSYKKLPFKVSVISKAFELEDEKLEIDYQAYRPRGHVLTEQERQYIVNDCRIVAQALKIQLSKGLTKMTNASDALNGYKEIISQSNFERWFPVLPLHIDADMRKAYKGGFTYLNPKYKDKRVKGGVTFDVNSLYPSVMYNCLLPWGYPIFFEGKYQHDEKYPLYIIHLTCRFRLKKDHIPTLQIKSGFRYVQTEYLTTNVSIEKGRENDDPVELYLTNVDYELLKDHYDLYDVEYINGWKFKGVHGLFKDYIDYWGHIKETTTGAMRQLAKLMLNSLYGKFATNPKTRKKIPVIDSEGVVRYTLDKEEYKDPVYTVMGCFITAYARDKTIRSAQSVYDRFIYADTDSLHLEGTEIPDNLDIHPTRLGAWKHEGTFCDSLFIRAKTYMESYQKEDGSIKTVVTCAGMPDNVKESVNYENFHSGSSFSGKLLPKRYEGGIVLTDTLFTIK